MTSASRAVPDLFHAGGEGALDAVESGAEGGELADHAADGVGVVAALDEEVALEGSLDVVPALGSRWG